MQSKNSKNVFVDETIFILKIIVHDCLTNALFKYAS